MFNLICKSVLHLKPSLTTSTTHKFRILQLNLLSTISSKEAAKPISENANQQSFVINYLINTCGFAPGKAQLASKHLSFDKPDKPNAVLSFLQEHGFSKPQIKNLVRICPSVIVCDPEKTLLPKIEFFESKGIEKEDITIILSRAPVLFRMSLENHLIPSFNLLSSLIQSKDRTVKSLKQYRCILYSNLNTTVLPNVEILRDIGVPHSNIVVLLTNYPRDIVMDSVKFKVIVDRIKKMGFCPTQVKFLGAIHVFRAMSKLTWEKKVEVYMKWGWSKEEVLVAFRKHPCCMSASEDKIMKLMDFLVNKMGFESSVLLNRPVLVSLSLDKRIVPRCHVYQVLASKGLVQNAMSLNFFLETPEKTFLKKFVECYAKEAPELLKLYKEKSSRSD